MEIQFENSLHYPNTDNMMIRVTNIDRSEIHGSFLVRIYVGEEVLAMIPVYQKGPEEIHCENDKYIQVHTIISDASSKLKPDTKITLRFFKKYVFTENETEIFNYGSPYIEIRKITLENDPNFVETKP